MKTHTKKQLTVICEQPVLRRITNVLDEADVTGFTVFPAVSGRGSEGRWHRDRTIGDAGRMVMVVCIMSTEHAEHVIEQIYQTIEPQMGIVTITDVEVLRPERF